MWGTESFKLPGWAGWAVFGVALVVRLLYWQATPDSSWPHSALYKGDAVVWAQYASALERGQSYELGLPLRPPGNAYLLSWLGVDTAADFVRAKFIWCLLGALAVSLIFRAALAAFGPAVALSTAAWCSFSTAMLVLSTSLNNETPYLVLLGLLLLLTPRIEKARSGGLLGWGALHGLACLVRVEHLLFFVLSLAWWVLQRRQREGKSGARDTRRLASVGAGFVLVLLPWHLASWSSLRDFNDKTQPLPPGAEAAQRSIETSLAGLTWTPEARATRAELPAFARRSAGNFVAATVAWRGGRQVTETDFGILEEAFGTRPERLREFPFVTLYGPLNFYLAHRPGAPVGFDPAGLDRSPTLAGGANRFPTPLILGLPPRTLNFQYPPHVEIVNQGYRIGLKSLVASPVDSLRRALARADIAWQGASMGWTGHGAPWGPSELRRAVDLAVPRGRGYALWRSGLAGLCALAVWRLRRSPVVWLWLMLAVYKVGVSTLFFGYARHGATIVPVVALLVSLLVAEPLVSRAPRQRLVVTLWVIVGLALASEVWRWADPPTVALDGRVVGTSPPFPTDQHLDRLVSYGEPR